MIWEIPRVMVAMNRLDVVDLLDVVCFLYVVAGCDFIFAGPTRKILFE